VEAEERMMDAVIDWLMGLLRFDLRCGSGKDDRVYLGAFGTSVGEQSRQGMHLVAVDSHQLDQVFEDLQDWCRDRGCKLFWDRVIWDQWHQRWESNGIGGADVMFIATADEHVATEAWLAWG